MPQSIIINFVLGVQLQEVVFVDEMVVDYADAVRDCDPPVVQLLAAALRLSFFWGLLFLSRRRSFLK